MTASVGGAVPPAWDAGGLDPAFLASLLELSHDAAFVRDGDGRIMFWNAGAEGLYGWSKADALGRRSHELLATRFPQALPEIEQQLRDRGSWEGELRHRTKHGDEVVVESRWAARLGADGGIAAILEVNRDVTARVAAERELAAEMERFRAIFEASLDAILLTSPDGRILAANAAAEALFGRSEAEIVAGGRPLLVDETDPRLAEAVRERARSGRARSELRMRRGDGSHFEADVSSVVFRDSAGGLRSSMVIRDVSERTAALTAARESEARFRALADASSEAVLLHEDGRIIDVNRAACTLLGYAESELTSMRVLDLAPPSERARAEEILRAMSDQPVEIRVLTAGGAQLTVEATGRTVTHGGRAARVVAARELRPGPDAGR